MVYPELDLDGREVKLRNGEIRVHGSDGRWYTAPTLIAHYVAAHDYLPPGAFIDGVVARANTLYVLSGEQLRRLRALSIDEQLDVCLRVSSAFPTQQHRAVEVLQAKIRAVATSESRGEPSSYGWEDGIPDELEVLEAPVASACWLIVLSFSRRQRLPEELRQDGVNSCMIHLLETAADLGVDARTF